MSEKIRSFVLYDGRAKTGDASEASVYVTASSEKEARRDGQDPSWHDGIWYEYEVISGKLVHGKPRWDLPPATKDRTGVIDIGRQKPSAKNTPKIKCELTLGQVVLVPHLRSLRDSKMWNGAIYRLLDMSFVCIFKPKVAKGQKPIRELFIMKIDNDTKQYIHETKENLLNAVEQRIREHPEFSKGLEILL